MAEMHEAIGDAFAEVLRSWLTPREMRRVRERNATEPDRSVCHSHDFCDANVAMDIAFERVVGREFDAEGDAALWSKAWDHAAVKHLGGNR